MLPERKTGGYRIRPYDIIDILYTNAAAGVHLQANEPRPTKVNGQPRPKVAAGANPPPYKGQPRPKVRATNGRPGGKMHNAECTMHNAECRMKKGVNGNLGLKR